jgi:uncharacterized protein (TIGR03083 family)
MDNVAYLAAVETAVGRFADLTAAADLDAQVPTCPDWDVAALVDHLVGVHTWVRKLLGGAEGFGAFDDSFERPERSPATFAAWYRDIGAAMHADLAAHHPGDPCWNFSGTNQTVGFWPRRQMNEINVHAFDAALAARSEFAVQPVEAADGIDEILLMLGPRLALRGIAPTLTAPITISPSDIDASWTVLPPREGGYAEVTDDTTGSVATLSGPASDIYFAMWNRLPYDRVTVTGDTDVAAAYLASRRVP